MPGTSTPYRTGLGRAAGRKSKPPLEAEIKKAVSFRVSLWGRGSVLVVRRTRRIGVCHRPAVLHKIGLGHPHHIVGRDLVVIVELRKDLAPVAEIGFKETHLPCESGITVELSNQRRLQLGFYALNGCVIHLFFLNPVDDSIYSLLVLLDRVA